MNDSEMSAGRRVVSAVEREEWVRKFRASGLTQREFGLQQGLKLSTLQYWVNRERRPTIRRRGRPKGPVFAEVKLPVAAVGRGWAAELVRPDGATLRIGCDLSPALLEQLLRAC